MRHWQLLWPMMSVALQGTVRCVASARPYCTMRTELHMCVAEWLEREHTCGPLACCGQYGEHCRPAVACHVYHSTMAGPGQQWCSWCHICFVAAAISSSFCWDSFGCFAGPLVAKISAKSVCKHDCMTSKLRQQACSLASRVITQTGCYLDVLQIP